LIKVVPGPVNASGSTGLLPHASCGVSVYEGFCQVSCQSSYRFWVLSVQAVRPAAFTIEISPKACTTR